jgi:hypothetical protein
MNSHCLSKVNKWGLFWAPLHSIDHASAGFFGAGATGLGLMADGASAEVTKSADFGSSAKKPQEWQNLENALLRVSHAAHWLCKQMLQCGQ